MCKELRILSPLSAGRKKPIKCRMKPIRQTACDNVCSEVLPTRWTFYPLTEAATVDFCLSWYTLKMQRFTFWKMKPHPERSLIDDTPVMDEKGADITPKSSEIVFNKVDFSYADRKILDQVSFTIPEKTTTAIVGPSGAGKTTMCNLIARFWDVNAGKITIGGTDVRDFKLDSLMKNISMVFQSVYLFADTIENNIKFGCPDATHEQVVEAAKKACCHDFISALPDGYDTVIGEGGGTLSGGEKQRISIARAMLKDAPIIILDEATSSVDPENEDELQRAIEALTHDKTIIMIAHRLKTVRNADQILVLDNAHIVQRGTHAELIQQKGLYADFVSARQEAIGWKLAQ